MEQKQYRKQEAGCALGRGEIGCSYCAGEFLSFRHGIMAIFIMLGLLCGSALSQLRGTTDVPKRSANRPTKGKKGTRDKRNARPSLARTRKPSSVQAKLTRPRKAQPGRQPTTKPNNDSLATKKPKNEARATNQAESKVSGDIDTLLLPPPLPDNTSSSRGNAFDTPIDTNTSKNPIGTVPDSWFNSPLYGSSPAVNPINKIADKNKVFVETVKNPDAHNIIVKELGKYPKLKIVTTPEEADFIISYTDKRGLELMPGSSSKPTVPTPVGKLIGEMIVYTLGEKQADGVYQRNVVWSEDEDRDKLWFFLSTGRHPATNLTRHFLKALRSLRGESK